MKNSIFLALFVITAFIATAQDNKTPFMTKSFSAGSFDEAEVQTSGGSITVTGSGEAPRVEVYIQPSNRNNGNLSKEEIQRKLDEDYELNVSVEGNTLVAKAKPKHKNINWKKALSISFKLFVPKNTNTDLATSGGSIRLTSLSGNHDFATSGGSLHLEEVSGKMDGRTSGGSIHVKNCSNEMELATSGGSIDATNCTGKMELTTSGGSLKLEGLDGDIEATTSGGSIKGDNIRGELNAHTSGGNVDLRELYCSLETSTSGGNINVSINEMGKYVKIANSSGNVDLRIPKNIGVNLKLKANKIKTSTLANFSGDVEEDQINGKLNGGGVPVTVDAGSGRISLELN
jgi:DUF4097 and DUF4098 domain-containing protein YvlB